MTSRPSDERLSCRRRIAPELRRTLTDIRKLWSLYQHDPDSRDDALGNLSEYGLCFDYIAPGTFVDQREAYWRYQLSWGGPSDEFRFFSSRPDADPYRIEYWFLDWFDGAHRVLHGKDEALMLQIWSWFKDCGQVGHTYDHSP